MPNASPLCAAPAADISGGSLFHMRHGCGLHGPARHEGHPGTDRPAQLFEWDRLMWAKDRHQRILAMLAANHQVSANDLAGMLNV